MTAQLSCTLQDFYKFIDPKIRNDVQSITKSKKRELNLVCQECGIKSNELEAAHKSGRSRRDIIKIVLDDYEFEDGKYIIPNLQKILERIRKEHLPIENNFRFLCKPCHTKYDDVEKREIQNKNIDQGIVRSDYTQSFTKNYRLEFDRLLSTNNNLKECFKSLFLKFPDINIKSTELRKIYEKHFPNENSQKVPDYLWSLTNHENFLESNERSFYKLVSKNVDQKPEP